MNQFHLTLTKVTQKTLQFALLAALVISGCAGSTPFDVTNEDFVVGKATRWHASQTRGTSAFFPGEPDETGARERIQAHADWKHATLSPLSGGGVLVSTPLKGLEDGMWIRRLVIALGADGAVTDGYSLHLLRMVPPGAVTTAPDPDASTPEELVLQWHSDWAYKTGDISVLLMTVDFRPIGTVRFVDGENLAGATIDRELTRF